MINAKKVTLMTRQALYEQGDASEHLKIRAYQENSRSRRRMNMENAFTGTMIYIAFAGIMYLVVGHETIDFSAHFAGSLCQVGAAAALGVFFVGFFTRMLRRLNEKRYKDVRSSLVRYDLTKTELKVIDGTEKDAG